VLGYFKGDLENWHGGTSDAAASWSAPALWRSGRVQKRQRAGALQDLAD